MTYIDTSVLVAYYCPEPLSRTAQDAILRVKQPAISPLVEVEFHSAIALKVRTGELDAPSGHDVLAELESDLAKRLYRIVPIGSAEYTVARDWLGRFSSPLRTLDALHLAAAAGNAAVLLTADRALAQSARHFKVKHRLIGQAPGQT